MPDRDTLVISDTHLGRRWRGLPVADVLEPVIASCGHLVVNGDLADVFHPRRETAARRACERFRTLCDRHEVDLTILTGNHDPTLSTWLAASLAGGQVYVTHGDVFHPSMTPWGAVASSLRAHRLHVEKTLNNGNRRSQSPSDALHATHIATREANFHVWEQLRKNTPGAVFPPIWKRPWAVVEVLRSWASFPALAASFASRHELDARYVIFGHTHRAGMWRFDGRVVINTGCFGFPGRPLAVRISHASLHVHRIERRKDQYQLRDHPLASFPLAAHDDAPSARYTRDASGLPIVRSI